MRVCLGVLLLLCLLTPSVAAQKATLSVDPSTREIVISEWLGTSSDTGFTRTIRLIAQGSDVDFEASSSLKLKGSDRDIKPQLVALVGSGKMKSGETRDFEVHVSGLSTPGRYQGEMRLISRGDGEVLVTIPLTVELRELSVDGADQRLVLSNWASNEAMYTASLRLRVAGGDVQRLTFLTSPLTSQDGEHTLARQNVEVMGDPSLSADIAKDFQVRVTGVQTPGTYTGTLRILAPGLEESRASRVDLVLHAKALEVTPQDIPLTVIKALGQDGPFQGELNLTARGGDIQFSVLPSDLKRKDGTEIIRRQYIQVSLVSGPDAKLLPGHVVAEGKTGRYRVALTTSPTVAGQYEGELKLLLEGQVTRQIIIPLIVVAEAVTITSDDADIVVTGYLGWDEGFTGHLRLTSTTTETVRFEFIPPVLKSREGDIIVSAPSDSGPANDPSRTPTAKPAQITLTPGQITNGITDFRVQIKGIRAPGTYTGVMKFVFGPIAAAKTLSVPLTVVAKDRPALVALPGSEQLQLHLVNCQTWIRAIPFWDVMDCGLAKWRRLRPTAHTFHFANSVAAPVSIEEVTPVIYETITQFQLPGSALRYVSPIATANGSGGIPRTVALPFTIAPDDIIPGQYSGEVQVALKGRNDVMKIPVTLHVASGSFWPIALLIFGILLGRLQKWMQDYGYAQATSLDEIEELKERVYSEVIEVNQETLRDGFLRLLYRIEENIHRKRLQAVPTDLADVRARLDLYRRMEDDLRSIGTSPEQAHLKEDLKKIQARLIEPGETVEKLTQDWTQTFNSRPLSDQSAGRKFRQDREQPHAPNPKPSNNPLDWVKARWRERYRWGAYLSRPIRGLLYGCLIFGLTWVGLETFYLNNPKFGANLTDYVGLIIWGLSADVASRTLSNLRGPTSR